MKLTRVQSEVYNFLKEYYPAYVSPTFIGYTMKGKHSAWASPHCLELVKNGYAKRSKIGWYRAIIVDEEVKP